MKDGVMESDADKRLRQPRDQALEPQGCVGNRQADAILALFGNRGMGQVFVGNLDVSRTEPVFLIPESPFQHQRKLQPPMAMIGNCHAARDRQKANLGVVPGLHNRLTHPATNRAPPHVFKIAADIVDQRPRKDPVRIQRSLDHLGCGIDQRQRRFKRIFRNFGHVARIFDQRASNRFDFFTTAQERADWGRRIREYFAERGVQPWRDP